MNFLRNFLASLLALIIFTVGVLLLVVSIVSSENLTDVKQNAVLYLKFNKPVTEREMENPLERFGMFGPSSTIGLKEFRETLNHAKTDDKIRGVVLDLDNFIAGMASIEELRAIIADFRASGKFVKSYANYYSEGAYYLASATDEIMLHPEGDLEFNGLSSTVVFLKGLFDKIGIEPEVFKVGDFKSAVEPFTRTSMSEESRLQLEELLQNLNNHIIENIASDRGIPREELITISDSMLVRNPEQALEFHLIDRLTYDDEMRAVLKEASTAEELNLVGYSDYQNSYAEFATEGEKIAVVIARGDIVMGPGEFGMIGSQEFIETIRELRQDEDIKAIVLRVNSPGGSYLASDAIWREVELATKEKPVIASMGDYAASGGYYISMACDTIVAQPNTITGSIGIFSVRFTARELLNDKLGITFDGVKTGKYSDMYESPDPLSEEERDIIQREIEKNYRTFIEKAAAGRNLSYDEMNNVASGRVWSGSEAVTIGLVDVLGNLETAIDIAAGKAGVSGNYRLRYYPPQKDFLDALFGSGESEINILQKQLGELYPLMQEVKKIKELQGVQARFPFEMEIH